MPVHPTKGKSDPKPKTGGAGKAMHPGDEKLSDLPEYLNGRSKMYVAAIGFLWTSLVGVGSWAVGSRSAHIALQAHEAIDGHPIMDTRVRALEQRFLDALGSIDRRLTRIETRLDGNP